MSARAKERVVLHWLFENQAPMSLTVKDAMLFVIQRRVMNAVLADRVMARLENLYIPGSVNALDLLIQSIINKVKNEEG